MTFVTGVALFLGFWSFVYLLDFYLRARSHVGYLRFAERTGFVVGPFQIRWYTSRFGSDSGSKNSPWFQSLISPRLLNIWFSMGVVFGVVTMICIVVFLSRVLLLQLGRSLKSVALATVSTAVPSSPYGTFRTAPVESDLRSSTDGETQSEGLVAVVPGVNVPLSQLPLFFVVLVIVGIFHELGHAVAAVHEKVAVNGFGVFVLGFYPGAFTEIDHVSLELIPAYRKLKIFCGGIWNNFTMAFVGVLLLQGLPYLLIWGYSTDGVLITEVQSESGLAGLGGLTRGSVVRGINHCRVSDEQSWAQCLHHISRTNYGHCVSKDDYVLTGDTQTHSPVLVEYLKKGGLKGKKDLPHRMPTVPLTNIGGELQCCPENGTSTHLCFYYKHGLGRVRLNLGYGNGTLPDLRKQNPIQYACLPARYVTDHFVCNNSLACPSRAVCVRPALFNETKLFRFTVGDPQVKPVLFIGFPANVLNFVFTSRFVPRFSLLPYDLPHYCELFLKYLVTFSLALAFLNAVPCYSLDGQFILSVLMDILPFSRRYARRKQLVYRLIMFYCTAVLICNVLLALWNFVRMRL